MLYVAGENMLPILVALLIGFITGLWIWKFARRGTSEGRVLTEDTTMRRPYVENRPSAPLPVRPAEPSRSGGPRPEPEVLARRAPNPLPMNSLKSAAMPTQTEDTGDNDVASGAAAAVEDVVDQFLGIDAHPAPADTPVGGADDLQVMKGVGPKLAVLLRAGGVTRFDQIASLTPDDLARLDAHLGAFKGRLVRDRIVQQAAFLAAGDRDGYEREFGKL